MVYFFKLCFISSIIDYVIRSFMIIIAISSHHHRHIRFFYILHLLLISYTLLSIKDKIEFSEYPQA